MANLISKGGAWTAAGSWGLIHAGSSQMAGVTAYTWPNAARGYTANFNGDDLEIDGIALYIEYRAAAPSGWVEVCLRQTSAPAADIQVIRFDVADLPSEPATGDGGFWIFIRLTNFTVVAGKTYAVGFQTQNASQIFGYRDATAANQSKCLRRTATGNVNSGDFVWIIGEITGQGTGNDINISYDNNVADAFAGLSIGHRGILNVKRSSTTQLQMAANFYVQAGGTFQQGTYTLCSIAAGADPIVTRISGSYLTEANGFTVGAVFYVDGTSYTVKTVTADGGATLVLTGTPGLLTAARVTIPIDADRTHTLQFNCVADNGYFLSVRSGGKWYGRGIHRAHDRALLAADVGGYCSCPAGANPIITRINGPLCTIANGFTVGASVWINLVSYVIRTATADGGATFQITGTPGALTQVQCLLVAPLTITTDVETGWLSGDDIAIAPTSQTYTQYERKTLGANAAAAVITLPSALIYVHDGTAPTQGEVINLTRNVMLQCSNAAYGFYWALALKSIVDLEWVSLAGFAGTTYIRTSSGGSLNVQRCAVKDCRVTPFQLTVATIDNIVIKNNVGYSLVTYSGTAGIYVSVAVTATTGVVIDGNWIIKVTGIGIYSADAGITIQYNIVSGCSTNGIAVTEANAVITVGFNNNKGHSCYEQGIILSNLQGQTGDGLVAYRCRGYTAPSDGFELVGCYDLIVGSLTAFGNRIANVGITTWGAEITFKTAILGGDIAFPCAQGVAIGTIVNRLKFQDSDFGVTSGIVVPHTTADIYALAPVPIDVELESTKLSSGAGKEVVAINTPESRVLSSDHGRSPGAFKSWFMRGVIEKDDTYFRTPGGAAPSQRLTPNSHSYKLKSGPKRFAMDSGTTATVKANVRKSSVAAGGALYDGNEPRLMVKANPLMNILTDQMLDTMVVAVDTWEELSGLTPAIDADGVLEVYVDCDGDTGFVNVDDWSIA